MAARKNIYLHIGFGKTGTTSIQDAFRKNREVLRESGLLYPKSGLRGTGHHDLAIPGPGGLDAKIKKRFYDLIGEIEKSDCTKVFISSEFFPWLKSNYVEFIRSVFMKYNVIVVVYVRNQVDLMMSAFLQWQKVGDNYRGSMDSFFVSHANSFNYMTRITPYLSAFGEDSIMARVYDKRICGIDVRRDILKLIEVDAEVTFAKDQSNISLLPEFSSIVSLLDEAEMSKEIRAKAILTLLELSHKFKSLSTEKLIDDPLEKKIISKYAKSNREFASLFLDNYQSEIFLHKGMS